MAYLPFGEWFIFFTFTPFWMKKIKGLVIDRDIFYVCM